MVEAARKGGRKYGHEILTARKLDGPVKKAGRQAPELSQDAPLAPMRQPTAGVEPDERWTARELGEWRRDAGRGCREG